MISKVKTLVFCEDSVYGDVLVMKKCLRVDNVIHHKSLRVALIG